MRSSAEDKSPKSCYAWTSASSGGIGDLGCLLSKCCLNVLGSGICVLHTGHVKTNAAFAAAFWSVPCFFFSACFLAFFCWDWIFCCPRAILKNRLPRSHHNPLLASAGLLRSENPFKSRAAAGAGQFRLSPALGQRHFLTSAERKCC